MHIVSLSGSPSPRSRSRWLLQLAQTRLEANATTSREIAVRELPSAALLDADTRAEPIRRAIEHIQRADLLLVATPIYKAAYSGLLKAFLDLLPQDGLHGKWIWPLATGGSPAHTLALDHSLRPVLDNLGAHQVVPSVYALESQIVLNDGAGTAHFDADVKRRLDIGAARLANALESQAHLRRRDERMRLSVVRCSA